MNPLLKYALTALLVVIASELAKRSDRLGALITALPLVTVLTMTWLFAERQGNEKIASHAYYTFWYVLPTLPMFLVMPRLLRQGWGYWPALGMGVVVTFVSFVVVALVVRRFGVFLLPE